MTDRPTQDDSPLTEESFLTARFAGGRFDAHAIPFDVLPDLAAYRGLIVEVAKMLFKKRNNDRVRVPKGFGDSFQIGLKRVVGGHSAVVTAVRLPQLKADVQGDLGFAHYPEFDDAKAYVDALIRKVATSGEVPEDFPQELAGRFNPFGQSLMADEYIELGYDTADPVRYDTFIRKRIVLSREQTYENAVDGLFVLDGGVSSTGTIHVKDANGSAFDFRPLSEFEFDKAYSRHTQQVRLVGTGLYDGAERLRRLLDVSVVYSEDEQRQAFDDRLDEVAQTEPGWYDPDTPSPSKEAIECMRAFIKKIVLEADIPTPSIYPLPDGGVAAEWTVGVWELSANIYLHTSNIELHAVNTSTLKDISKELNIRSSDYPGQFRMVWDVVSSATGSTDAGI